VILCKVNGFIFFVLSWMRRLTNVTLCSFLPQSFQCLGDTQSLTEVSSRGWKRQAMQCKCSILSIVWYVGKLFSGSMFHRPYTFSCVSSASGYLRLSEKDLLRRQTVGRSKREASRVRQPLKASRVQEVSGISGKNDSAVVCFSSFGCLTIFPPAIHCLGSRVLRGTWWDKSCQLSRGSVSITSVQQSEEWNRWTIVEVASGCCKCPLCLCCHSRTTFLTSSAFHRLRLMLNKQRC
jgi:hypothetical protein